MSFGLTITAKAFHDRTARGIGHYRGSRLHAVEAALEAYEGNWTVGNLTDLRNAIRDFRQHDAAEFRRRDQVSQGLCTQLADEVERKYTERVLRPPDAGVHVITPAPSSVNPTGVASRACTFQRHDADIHAYLPFLSERRRGRVGVMLIDVLQAGAEEVKVRGLQEKYDANPVIDNIGAVLDAAGRLGLAVFEITTGSAPTIAALQQRLPTNGNLVSFRKTSQNAFNNPPGVQLKDLVAARLGTMGERFMFVMGFDGNICVRGTVFGGVVMVGPNQSTYRPGLLGLGYTVVTSRTVLATHHSNAVADRLIEQWGPLTGL
jgi:hypothetical protein